MSTVFNIEGPDEYARLREVLRRAEYNEHGLIELLGPIQLPTRAGRDLPYYLHATRALQPLDVLTRLFVAGAPVAVAVARRTLAPLPLEVWLRAGLIELRDGEALGRVRLLPFRGMLLACDYADPIEPGGRLEQVMGLTESSIALADFAVRRPAGATLDLGTGSGIQAFLAAAHSQQSCGVDRSPRAIQFARFNAGLNAVGNCEFLEGNSFEPVRGRTFDLVVSNPPFAITPSLRYMYRDSGMELDAFCRGLVRQAPSFLNEGGIFQICCDWAHLSGQDWKARLAGWFEDCGCDVWLLRTGTCSAAEYARIWLRDTEHATDEDSARLYNEWLSYYEANGVEAISTGLIAMRRTSRRANWTRMEELPSGSGGRVGDAVSLGFELHDYLASVRAGGTLAGEKLRLSPLVRLEESLEPAAGGWQIASARIRLASGLTYSSPVDVRLAGLIAGCDGQHTVRELLARLAAATNSELEKITPNCLALLGELVERGFLLPPGVEGPTSPAAEG